MFVANPSIFGDELIYWSMARNFHHGLPLVAFNVHFDIPTQLYPLLISPLFAAGDSTVVYPLVKLVSCLMFCSVVFPAYFLARELLTYQESLLVALLSLLVPGGVYSATVMAENLYYPFFVLTAWLSYRALYRGRWGDSSLAGLAFAATYYAKPHVLFLMAAYGIALSIWLLIAILRAPSLHAGIRQSLPGLLYRSIPFAVFALSLAIRVWELAGYGHSLADILFGHFYAGGFHVSKHLPFAAFLESGTWLLVVLTISTAWLPVLAMIESAFCWKRFADAHRWFWVFSSCAALIFLVMIARYNVLNDAFLRSHERYIFQLSPLLFTWYFASRRLLSSRWLFPVAGLFVIATSLALARSSSVLTWSSASDAPTFTGVFWARLRHPTGELMLLALLLCGGLLCLLAAASARPRRLFAGWAAFLIVCNIGWYGFQLTTIQHIVKPFSEFAWKLKVATPPSATIGFLQDQADIRAAWYANFWLPQPMYYYGDKEQTYWFVAPITRAPDGALNFGRPRPQLILAADSLVLPYNVIREFPELRLRLYQVPTLTEMKSPK